MALNVLLNKIYTKFHKALFTLNADNIGISFPKYKVLLGNTIRLHSSKQSMKELQSTNWIGGLSGYCDISAIQEIPEQVKYRTISRKQANMTEAKLRRLIKRSTISSEETKKYKTKMFSQSLENAYLELDSNSNGHKYRRYIQFGELQDKPVNGHFDTFGLSKTATIPWF
ncbi:MAG: type I-F CRISPR-associated endoribonuclease Cas6/Csy4 [Gammaproteobacteria bacterium]|nr:type I-F CRISPR-associated endoribonuclease Cas6/Csy4 [Gammaproteobacteria bacterium]